MASSNPIDELDYTVKLILTIFLDGIVMGLNRIFRGKTIVGVIWILTGGIFGIGWIIDIISMVTKKDITFLA